MASSTQVRTWWKGYQRNTARYVKVNFPGKGRTWSLWVADKSAPVWNAVAQIMASEPYLFLESAGGTYSPREPGSTSLHTYALALDLNPSKNPMKNPPVHNYPATFIKRMEGIRANGKQAIYWGGRWPASNPPDTMHWQINVAPGDCVKVTWDKGGGAPAPIPPPSGGNFTLQITRTQIKKGSSSGMGGDVAIAQGLLHAWGYGSTVGAVDGDFGDKTDQATRAFQKAKKLTVDGIIGEGTWKALES